MRIQAAVTPSGRWGRSSQAESTRCFTRTSSVGLGMCTTMSASRTNGLARVKRRITTDLSQEFAGFCQVAISKTKALTARQGKSTRVVPPSPASAQRPAFGPAAFLFARPFLSDRDWDSSRRLPGPRSAKPKPRKPGKLRSSRDDGDQPRLSGMSARSRSSRK